jgi:hypothetical protein
MINRDAWKAILHEPVHDKRWRRQQFKKMIEDTRKNNARSVARNHSGKIKKESCELCGLKGKANLELHHFDYDRPLYTITVCRKCHGLITQLTNQNGLKATEIILTDLAQHEVIALPDLTHLTTDTPIHQRIHEQVLNNG